MGKSGLPPGFPSVEGVVFIFVGFYREILSPGLDLVFCFFLGLVFPTVFHREMPLDWRPPLSLEPGRLGESPA